MKYIIDDDMLMQWRSWMHQSQKAVTIINAMAARMMELEQEKNCCEFDDDAMQKIFQSQECHE